MLPALLYEMLPLTYISAGALMISAGQELLVLLSAFCFIAPVQSFGSCARKTGVPTIA